MDAINWERLWGSPRDERTRLLKTAEEDAVSAVGQERAFIAGKASGPNDTQYSLAQASAATMKALISIGRQASIRFLSASMISLSPLSYKLCILGNANSFVAYLGYFRGFCLCSPRKK